MIQTIKIKNVALIEEATLQFDSKLNVISGETGAGKSIMLDSLSFVFGGRADRSLIRSGADKMKVEAIFTNLSNNQKRFLKDDFNIDVDDELFLSRELDFSGRNICKINGELIPLASVKKICLNLVDIHGQSEHLAILNNDYQLEIVDLMNSQIEKEKTKLAEFIEQIKQVDEQIKSLGGSETEKQNLIDLYSYQINEIELANIKENEFEELSSEKKSLQAFEKINENLSNSYSELTASSMSENVLDKLNNSLKNIQNISSFSDSYKEIENRLNSLRIELDDVADCIKTELNNNVFDQARFDFIDERLDKIKSLFRKYGGDFESLTEYYNQITVKLDNLINSAEKYQILTKERENLLNEIDKIQNKIHDLRLNSANTLKQNLQKELRGLGMPNAKIDIQFDKIPLRYSLQGFDRVEFMFSSNLGFELKPLNKVVSGGEMSRVMLAYKIVVSEIDDISTIVFDEIDTGLSGNIASIVAQYLAKLSLKKQIIAVSHLPQICAMADYNIKVEKFSTSNTTHTKATVLTQQDLLKEIARLMGAGDGEIACIASEQLKDESNKFKTTLKIST